MDRNGFLQRHRKTKGNLITLKYFTILHFIINSNDLLLKYRADLNRDVCLFVCLLALLQSQRLYTSRSKLYYHTNRFLELPFICLEAEAIKLEAHKESVTVFSCHDVLIFYIRYILNLSHLEFLPINPNFTLLK